MSDHRTMPFERYRQTLPPAFPGRTWPSRHLNSAPQWCSVDLRDGNQALVEPMDPIRKKMLFDALAAMGFGEIEVGFPSASQPDFDFCRMLAHEGLATEDLSVQVLVQCRRDLIERTFKAIEGIPRAVVHFYNSTSELQRRIVFNADRTQIRRLAEDAAKMLRDAASSVEGTDIRWEYSPESFTGTEPEFALEVCEAVLDILEPTVERPVILNLPATVEMYSPNVFADVVEWFSTSVSRRDAITLSVHPHNDRGTAVAAAELAVLAGAQRVEGTLFGNGERTGNVDIVTLAMNLFSQGVDPRLDLSDIDALRSLAEYCTGIPVHQRHPYAGDLVFTAFSGSHQDAINKGMLALGPDATHWEVPYLPIDPKDVGRTYEEVIRVNSQSGKGGVAYLMRTEHGLELPRGMQIEFSKHVQAHVEDTGADIASGELLAVFCDRYCTSVSGDRQTAHTALLSYELITGDATLITARLASGSERFSVVGSGTGPIDAFVAGVAAHSGQLLDVTSYAEHALGEGSDAKAVAYVELDCFGERRWGAGIHADIVTASLRAVLSALESPLVAMTQGYSGGVPPLPENPATPAE